MIYINKISIAKYSIVIHDKCHPSIKCVADFFNKYIEKTCGVVLPIQNESNGNSVFFNLLNNDSFADSISIDIGKNLVFSGNNYRSIRFAVIEFLERFLGWRFYDTNFEICKNTSDIFLQDNNYSYTPQFEYRLVLSNMLDKNNNDLLLKQKNNALFAGNFNDQIGNASVVYPIVNGDKPYRYSCHTYQQFLSPDKYFDEHPEYFSLQPDGTRSKKSPCLSNPKVFEIMLEEIKSLLRSCPEANIVSVTQNDISDGYCQCPKCKANIEKYQSDGANELIFANKIARAIKDEFPNVKVETLAYNYTTKPPVGIKVEDNVSIKFCLMSMCREHSIIDASCPFTERIRSWLNGWSNIAKTIYLWDYTANYKDYLLPLKNYSQLYDNLNYYSNYNVKGIMVQYINNTDCGGFYVLWTYMQSKLFWNPKMSYVEYLSLIKEFLQDYYGPGADYLYDYLVLHSNMPTTNEHYGPYMTIKNYMKVYKTEDDKPDDSFFIKSYSLFDKAYELADDIQKERIAIAKLSLDKMYLCLMYDYSTKQNGEVFENYKKRYIQYVDTMKKYSFKEREVLTELTYEIKNPNL